MKQIAILITCMLGAMSVQADLLTDILDNRFQPKVMSVAEQDSVLNGASTERYVLVEENKQTLFRHSYVAEYYLLDKQKGKRVQISDGPIRDAVLSPNGKYVVYGKADGNLYIYKVDFKTEVAITTDGYPYYNGIADWLYEEEFGQTCLFAFSPDSKQVAFIRLNESNVPVFRWQNMLPTQALSVTEQAASYPTSDSLRYPRAGEKNPKASVHIYDIYYKSVHAVSMPEQEDSYMPRIVWSRDVLVQPAKGQTKVPEAYVLNVLRLNRDQNRMEVFQVNPKSMVSHLYYKEESRDCYVNYELFDQWQWLSNGHVLALSEKDGFQRVYDLSPQGDVTAVLTAQKRDVTEVYGYDEATKTLYYQAAPTPETRQVYAVQKKKTWETRCLTKGEGFHSARFSKDYKHYIECYENISTPNRYTLFAIDKQEGRVVLDNDSIAAVWRQYGLNDKQFFTIVTEREDTLHAWQLMPKNFDKTKRYPVVMMHYSGPSSQRVLNRWRKRFEEYVAQQGYIVVCVDPRGTAGRGRKWKNMTYMELGRKEAEDQAAMAKYLKRLPWVDGKHIGIIGWSYGGYETLMCLSTQNEQGLWKCGVAIAPVTDWRLYDSAYTERFLRRPQVNESGYEQSSAINCAGQLQGDLLLVHGMTDDNVHAQHSWLYVDALVKAGKQFDMQFYPDDNHFLKQRNNYKHLHTQIIQYLNKELKIKSL